MEPQNTPQVPVQASSNNMGTKVLLGIGAGILVGLGIGYFLFSYNTNPVPVVVSNDTNNVETKTPVPTTQTTTPPETIHTEISGTYDSVVSSIFKQDQRYYLKVNTELKEGSNCATPCTFPTSSQINGKTFPLSNEVIVNVLNHEESIYNESSPGELKELPGELILKIYQGVVTQITEPYYN